jgi:hypothetical protein
VAHLALARRPRHVCRLQGVRHGQVVDSLVIVEARVALARVQAAR